MFKNRLLDYMSDDLDIAFGHYNSLNEELDKNVAGDILLFTLTIALMMLYAGIATFTARYFLFSTSVIILWYMNKQNNLSMSFLEENSGGIVITAALLLKLLLLSSSPCKKLKMCAISSLLNRGKL